MEHSTNRGVAKTSSIERITQGSGNCTVPNMTSEEQLRPRQVVTVDCFAILTYTGRQFPSCPKAIRGCKDTEQRIQLILKIITDDMP